MVGNYGKRRIRTRAFLVIPSCQLREKGRFRCLRRAAVTVAVEAHSWSGGVCTGTVETEWYDKTAASFDIVVGAKTADGFFFTVRKTVALLADHTGGTAACVKQAVCEVCGAPYGDIDAARHDALCHVAAKAATQEAEGNVEYWFCADCGKYFVDADGQKELSEADLVTEKIPPEKPEESKPAGDTKPAADAKAPKTGDTFRPVLLLAAMVLCAGAAVGTVIAPKRRKHDR